jgi:hypothetical protein
MNCRLLLERSADKEMEGIVNFGDWSEFETRARVNVELERD